jgi:hypothetical protein
MLILQRPLKSFVIKSIWKEGGRGRVKIISALKKKCYLKKFFLLLPPPPPPSSIPPLILPSLSFLPLFVATKIKITQRILTVATVRDVAGFDTEPFVAPPPPPALSNKQTERQRETELWSVLLGVKLCGVSGVMPLEGVRGGGCYWLWRHAFVDASGTPCCTSTVWVIMRYQPLCYHVASRDSSVGIVNRPPTGPDAEFDPRQKIDFYLQSTETDSGHYLMSTQGSFQVVKAARTWSWPITPI